MVLAFRISVKETSEVDAVKKFALSFFSNIPFYEENIDSCSKGNDVCGEEMGLRQMDPDELDELMDSIPSGLFAKELTKLNVDIKRFFIGVEDCFTGIGSINGGQLAYEFCDDYGEYPMKKVTGSVKDGFTTEESDFDPDEADRIRNSIFW